MTANQLALVRALAEDRIQDAKKYAACCCAEDTTKKNEQLTKKYQAMLEKAGLKAMELPAALAGTLSVEDVSGFREGRYYLGENEAAIFKRIEEADRASGRLMEMGIPYLNSTLLYGEPGTGKTMFSRYAAYKLRLPFAYVNFPSLIDSYLGQTGKNLKKVFDFCRDKRCVLMLDEIDCIGLKRGGSGDGPGGELARTTICLMQELDTLTGGQVLIAATNRMDRLDPALQRRFFQSAELSRPDERGRAAVACRFLDDAGVPYDRAEVEGYAKGRRTQADMARFAAQLAVRWVLSEEVTTYE